MAEKNTMTRKQALENVIAFLNDNAQFGDNWANEIEVLSKMLDSISKPRAKQVSKARIGNEALARTLHNVAPDALTTKGATELGIPEIMTTQKASAVLRVGVEMGLFEKVVEGKKVSYRKIG